MVGKPQPPEAPLTPPFCFEEKLWAAADKMRGHMDAAEYKHVALPVADLCNNLLHDSTSLTGLSEAEG